jgi:protein-disulfide isomerase
MKPSLILLLGLAICLAAPSRIDTAKTFGNPAAPVTIVLFSDFQCPACGNLHKTLMPYLMRDYVQSGKAYLVYKEFPLMMHAHAKEAATYAVASARVGKYEQVADALFQSQASWGADGKVWETVASVLTPAEQKKVQALVKDQGVLDEVTQDIQEGMEQNVNQTPTMVFIRGTRRYPIGGPNNYNLLRTLLDDLSK